MYYFSKLPEAEKFSISDTLTFILSKGVSMVKLLTQYIVIEKFHHWNRIRLTLFILNIFFSTAFITLCSIVLILHKDLRKLLFLFLDWFFWTTASAFILAIRSLFISYHFARIMFDLLFFFWMQLLNRLVVSLQFCAYRSLHEENANQILLNMQKATTFHEWLCLAEKYDDLHHNMEWRRSPASSLYDWKRLEEHTERLHVARQQGNLEQVIFLLQLCCYPDFCGISNKNLYTKALSGTKNLIDNFTEEVSASLQFLCSTLLSHLHDKSLERRRTYDNTHSSVVMSVPRVVRPYFRFYAVCDTSTQTESPTQPELFWNRSQARKITSSRRNVSICFTESLKIGVSKPHTTGTQSSNPQDNISKQTLLHAPSVYGNSLSTRLLRFFSSVRLSLGSTALCLSGGGSLAMYHMGVVKALLLLNCLPNIISGTSGGSIVAGVMAIFHDDELLTDILKPDIVSRYGCRWFPPLLQQVKHFFFQGHLITGEEFINTCKSYYQQWTFAEAYERTGRCVSIVVTPSCCSPGEALVLNFVTAPDVFIWSAVSASCSLPGLLPPCELFAKGLNGDPIAFSPTGIKWIDGSLTQDIPIKELGTMFNVKQAIVSQVNPHHTPFVEKDSRDSSFMRTLENWIIFDIRNRYSKLAKFNMIPRIFGNKFTSFWMVQDFEGHITIVPEPSIIDWYRIVMQPTVEDMNDYIMKGQARTWIHSPRIKQMLKIEHTLDECFMRISAHV